MNRVLKYQLYGGVVEIPLPINAKVLTIELQNGDPHMWILVPEQGDKVNRKFFTFATGEGVDESMNYIGTFFPMSLVFHVFEGGTP